MCETMNPTRGPVDFFVSYTAIDEAWAEWIAWWLEVAGYKVIFQKWDFRPGHNFALKMQNAACAAKHTIAVLTEAYLEAANCKAEWAASFVQDPDSEARKLIGVRVGDCNPEGLLKGVIYIDLVGMQQAHEAAITLLQGVRSGRGKAYQEPNFPGALLARSPAKGGKEGNKW